MQWGEEMQSGAKNKEIVKSVVQVTSLVIGIKLIGFIKQVVVASIFGATLETDAYFSAFGFITGLTIVFLQALSMSNISVYAKVKETDGINATNRLMSGLLEIFLVMAVFIMGIIIIILPLLAKVLAPSYDANGNLLLQKFIAELLPVFILMTIELILGSVLNAEKKFGITRLEGLFYSVIIIVLCLVYRSKYGVGILIIGRYVSYILFIGFLVIRLPKYIRFTVVKHPFREKNVIWVLSQMGPLLVGNAVVQLNQIIDRTLASYFKDGAVSALNYAHVLEQLVSAALIVETGNILFSHFSTMFVRGEKKEITLLMEKALKALFIILIPTTIVTFVCSEQIVRIVYLRGNFSLDAVELTQTMIKYYALKFPFLAIQEIISRSCYAYNETKGPAKVGAVSVIINIILSVFLSTVIGLKGIAMGTVIATIIGSVLITKVFRKLEPLYSSSAHKQLLVMLVISIPAIFVTMGIHNCLKSYSLMCFIMCVLSCGFVYAVSVCVFKNLCKNKGEVKYLS